MGVYKDYILFECTIIRGTWEKTWGFSKKHLILEIFVGFFSAVTGFLVHPFDQFDQFQSALLLAVITVVLMFISIFLSYLFTAPFRLWRKQSADTIELRTQIKVKQDKEKVLTQFGRIAELGNQLKIQRINENEFEAWKQNVNAFRSAASHLVKEYASHTERINFNTTQFPTNQKFVYSVNDEHNRELTQLTVQMDKFISIIENYEKKD